ncbi:MAG: hypothetical protein WBV47_02560, partial [Salegentibacter sp.]
SHLSLQRYTYPERIPNLLGFILVTLLYVCFRGKDSGNFSGLSGKICLSGNQGIRLELEIKAEVDIFRSRSLVFPDFP